MNTATAAPVKTVVTDREGVGTQPVLVVKVSPWRLVLTRGLRTWLQTFLGFAGLLVVGSLAVDPGDWARWLQPTYLLDLGQRTLVCVIVATAVAVVAVLQNALELMSKLDERAPELRG